MLSGLRLSIGLEILSLSFSADFFPSHSLGIKKYAMLLSDYLHVNLELLSNFSFEL